MENRSEARKMIFDFGGHVGQDTDYYLKLGFRVVTVEPNPELAARLRNRFREQIVSGALSVVEAAIAEKPGTGSFFKFEKSVFGTISPDWTARNTQMGAKFEEIQVEYMTVAQLFDQFGCPYYMKLDIEGADIICVEALRHLPKPSFLSVEVEKHDFAKFSSDVTLIHDLGYESFQLVQQETVPFNKIPHPPREGRPVSHRFPFGASGMFGRDLAEDRWISFEALLRSYEPIVAKHAKYGDFGLGKAWLPRQLLRVLRLYPGWHDLHCRFGAPKTGGSTKNVEAARTAAH